MTSERDPRKDPKPGDTVRVAKCKALVSAVDEYIHWKCLCCGEDGRCTPSEWREWAFDAEVPHAAD